MLESSSGDIICNACYHKYSRYKKGNYIPNFVVQSETEGNTANVNSEQTSVNKISLQDVPKCQPVSQ